MTNVAERHTQTARINCRIDAQTKQRAEEAARALGQSMTDFAEAAIAEKAEAVLERIQRITLSERDFARFVALIESPAPPTAALRDAMAEYDRLRQAHPESNL